MSKIGLIIKREYLNKVSKKSFILLSLLMPFFMGLLVFVPLWLSSIKSDETKQVAVIDQTGIYSALFKDTPTYKFIKADQSLEDYKTASNKKLFAILQITDNLLEHPKAVAIYSDKQIPKELSSLINSTLSTYLEKEKIASYNIPDLTKIIADSKVWMNVQTIKWGEDGTETVSSSTVTGTIGMIFTFIIYIFILMYGAMVMQSVTEEKTNRIVELMISSVKPFDLMMGKITAIGLVGLTQLFIWGVLSVSLIVIGQLFFLDPDTLAASAQATAQMQGGSAMAMQMQTGPVGEMLTILNTVNWGEIILYFILYFIGGYLLYGSFFAAIGAAVDSPEDTQQFVAPVSILLIFAFYAGVYSMENPDGPLAFWCSMIPFTSPVVMMIRIPFEIVWWEKLLSIVILYASAIAVIWVSAKIYRVGILMYGKKPTVKELIKWLRYK